MDFQPFDCWCLPGLREEAGWHPQAATVSRRQSGGGRGSLVTGVESTGAARQDEASQGICVPGIQQQVDHTLAPVAEWGAGRLRGRVLSVELREKTQGACVGQEG